MTFDQFVTKWTGKPVDFDGVYPNQCMDLMHQYVYDVLNIVDKRCLAAPAAYQVFTNFDNIAFHELFTKTANTATNVPQKGDIVVFGTQIGQFGHVCIFIEGNANSFRSFDANWPTGSLPHIQSHNYTGVLGWLRHIEPVTQTTSSNNVTTNAPAVISLEQYQTDLGSKNVEISALNDKLTKLQTDFDQLNDKVLGQTNQIGVLQIQLVEAQKAQGLLVSQASTSQLLKALLQSLNIWKN